MPAAAGQSACSKGGTSGISAFAVRTARGLRFLERRVPHAGVERCHGAWQSAEVAVETPAIEDLRNQAAVGQRGRVAEAVGGGRQVREFALELLQPVAHPVAVPGGLGFLVEL